MASFSEPPASSAEEAPPTPTAAPVTMDPETLILLRQRIAELEIEKSLNQKEVRATLPSLTTKDLAREMGDRVRQKQLESARNRQLVLIAMQEGNVASKALPSQYEHKADTTHDKTAAAVRHHTGSHYHMAGSVQFQRG
jgi:cell division septum initiation protein DivIVA